MNILVWVVHDRWTTAFVQGPHRYLLPCLPGRGPWGRGRPDVASHWPAAACEVAPARLAHEHIDVVVLQRPEEWELTCRWTRRRPGRDIPAVYVEHNEPPAAVDGPRHPVDGREDVALVHVSPVNAVLWSVGSTPTTVIEYGVPDPGYRYSGTLARAAVVDDRGAVRPGAAPTRFGATPLDVFDGRGAHAQWARRRVYLHPHRGTSPTVALIEAMHLGMPVVARSDGAMSAIVPPQAGVCSSDPAQLRSALRDLVEQPALATAFGREARRHALARFGIDRFLGDWERLLGAVRVTG
jgi:hypothetical protein